MRRRLSQDAWIMVLLLGFLVVMTIAVGSHQRTSGGIEMLPRRTTYSTRPGGLRALYATLHKLGYRTVRHVEPLTELPADGVLFIVAPERPIPRDEWRAVRTWLDRGNLLILTADYDLPDLYQKRKAIPSRPICPSFLSPDVRAFTLDGESRIEEAQWWFGHDELPVTPGGG